ncbi:MAG TPA: M23 family metallopeptidase [Acidothermaceae bacterium]|nr:M23 family metallopeptidase [Acidothermaceae bacterium]
MRFLAATVLERLARLVRWRQAGALLVTVIASSGVGGSPTSAFQPPVQPFVVLHSFARPMTLWGPGNRGVDLAARRGQPVYAVAAGEVAYAGLLAGRGVVSIQHTRLRTTYEPVDAAVARGQFVGAGQLIGWVSAIADNCGPPGSCLHWGAISAAGYVDPLTLLAPARPRLLPIWPNGPPNSG